MSRINRRSERIASNLALECRMQGRDPDAELRARLEQVRQSGERRPIAKPRDAEDLAEDARDPLDTARGVAAGIVITVILAVMACAWLWLLKEWIAAGGWLH
jgi:hypothetical protein